LRIPNNYLASIAKGKNGDIALEDGVLNVPPVLIPSFPVPRPQRVVNGAFAAGRVFNDSVLTTLYDFRTNQAAGEDQMFFLLSGLWRVQMDLIIWNNFAVPDAAFVLNIDVMDQAGSRMNLISVYSSAARQNYHERHVWDFHIEPRPDLSVVQGDVWTFIIQFPATNAVGTNSIQIQSSLNLHRFL